jgi:cell division inhibitor SepF
MFEKWIKKLSSKKEDEADFEFKSYEAEKEDILPVSEPAQEEENLPMQQSNENNIELKVVRPESMEEVFTIADYVIDGCTAVLNLELLDKETIKRMLDFLNGVTYTTGGEVRNVSQGTYIVTPRSGIKTVM